MLPVENGLVSGLWRSDLPQISEKPTTNGTSPPAVPRTGVIPLPSTKITNHVIQDHSTTDILENACGVSLHQVNGSRIEQFFSQNISKYFWWYICISPDSDGGCNQGFFDLQIRDLRKKTTDDIDLNGLPLHFIAGDLYNLMGKLFAMPDVQYVWTGQECFFKGT
ncbi:uncharacterized protein LOC127855994 [Dreissena polymorpha]|uniref:uncharacterized protein LOC127855994 n=1 Tax=Dreissena polymorpha TaxID=45954 RepID=UPI002263DE39|nr:uncharacterized protein LOC127855994 [Dreissena polymorpha]